MNTGPFGSPSFAPSGHITLVDPRDTPSVPRRLVHGVGLYQPLPYFELSPQGNLIPVIYADFENLHSSGTQVTDSPSDPLATQGRNCLQAWSEECELHLTEPSRSPSYIYADIARASPSDSSTQTSPVHLLPWGFQPHQSPPINERALSDFRRALAGLHPGIPAQEFIISPTQRPINWRPAIGRFQLEDWCYSSFLGLIDNYGRFHPRCYATRAPFREATRRGLEF